MKIKMKTLLFFISIIAPASTFAQGGGKVGNGGGGELLFHYNTEKISKWLMDNSETLAQKLRLSSISPESLVSAFENAVKSTPDVRFIQEKNLANECAKGDSGACLLADHKTRICMNHATPNFIRCNEDLYDKSSGDLQFAINFHEYLGIAGIEANGDDSAESYSNYPVSKYLMHFAQPSEIRYDLRNDEVAVAPPGLPVEDPVFFDQLRKKYSGQWFIRSKEGAYDANIEGPDNSMVIRFDGKIAEVAFYNLTESEDAFSYIPSVGKPGDEQVFDNYFVRKGKSITCVMHSNDLKADPMPGFICQLKIKRDWKVSGSIDDLHELLYLSLSGNAKSKAIVVPFLDYDPKTQPAKLNVEIDGVVAGHLYEDMPYPEQKMPYTDSVASSTFLTPTATDPNPQPVSTSSVTHGFDYYKMGPDFFCTRTENRDPNAYSCQLAFFANGAMFHYPNQNASR